jgi:signal transduction histidine kinase
MDVDVLRDPLRRIAQVAESLTRFSGRRRLNTRLVDVNALVQRVFQPAGAAGPPDDPKSGPRTPTRVVTRSNGPACKLTLARERLEVLGAPDLLRAAMDALKDRADRVTPPTGAVEVETRLVPEGGATWAEVVVADGGPPPAEGELLALFDPFPDADAVTEGSGLEMAAAAGIVRNHGGAVAARPAARGGTTIVVRLPARGRTGAESRREEVA